MDPRVERTRRALQQALLELAREHPLDVVTVADIAERAGVNRSTFYHHYSDKETLLADALDAVAEDFGARLGEADVVTIPPPRPPQALFAYLAHIADNAALYRQVIGDRGAGVVMARVRSRIEEIARTGLSVSGGGGYPGLPVDVVAAGITGSALGVVSAWLARDPLPPVDTAAEWVWRVLLGPGEAWG